jgi:hypothetical protein
VTNADISPVDEVVPGGVQRPLKSWPRRELNGVQLNPLWIILRKSLSFRASSTISIRRAVPPLSTLRYRYP